MTYKGIENDLKWPKVMKKKKKNDRNFPKLSSDLGGVEVWSF